MVKSNIAGIKRMSSIDSDDISFVIYYQGCNNACPGCHNPELQENKVVKLYETNDIILMLKDVIGLVSNLVLQGGEPMLQPDSVKELSKEAKKLGFNVWMYTGFKFETLSKKVIKDIDVIIDGRYIERLKGIPKHGFGGSTNQRMFKQKNNVWVEVKQ